MFQTKSEWIREIVLGSLFFFLLPDSQCHSRIRELERVSWTEGEKNTNCCMRWSFVFVVVLGPFFLKSGRSLSFSLSHLRNSIDRGWESERVNRTLWPPLLRFDFSDAHYRCCTYMNRWTSNKHALHPIFLLSLIPKTKKMLLGFAFGLISLSNQMRFGGLRKTEGGLSDATR